MLSYVYVFFFSFLHPLEFSNYFLMQESASLFSGQAILVWQFQPVKCLDLEWWEKEPGNQHLSPCNAQIITRACILIYDRCQAYQRQILSVWLTKYVSVFLLFLQSLCQLVNYFDFLMNLLSSVCILGQVGSMLGYFSLYSWLESTLGKLLCSFYIVLPKVPI